MDGEAQADALDDVLRGAIGPAQAAAVRAALDAAGLIVVPMGEIDQLRTEAAGYRRMRALVEPDGD